MIHSLDRGAVRRRDVTYRTRQAHAASGAARIIVAALLVLASAPVLAQTGAADRARELVQVMNSGDYARARAFVRSAYSPEFLGVASEEQHIGILLARVAARAGVLELLGVDSTGATWALAAVHNRLTEEVDTIVVETESTAPWRMTGWGVRPGVARTPESARSDAERVRELDRLVRKLADAGAFSGVVLLAKDGAPLYFEAVGVANRDFDIPITRDTRFNLGSANKSMTAVIIGQLVEEGKVSWDDPLSKFLPDFPDSASARRVQIKHLLSHTSGLGSYFNQEYMRGNRARWRTVNDFMALARPDSLRFAPGTRWSYSNTGMMALGKVIEVVTERDYFANVQERIFDRVGMRNSGFYEMDLVNRKLATGYMREYGPSGAEFRTNLFEHVVKGGPAGGGWSTAEDILAYSEALRRGTLVKRETFDLMRTPKPELSSPRYGYGFVLFEGPDIWGHGGDFPGIDFDWSGYGDSGYTLVILANYDRVNDPIKRKVTRMMRAAGAVK